jgi:hypothetical protein
MRLPDPEFKEQHLRGQLQRAAASLLAGEDDPSRPRGRPKKDWRPSGAEFPSWAVRVVNSAWQQCLLKKQLTFDGYIKAALGQTRSTRIRLHKYDCILVDEVRGMADRARH